MKNHILISGTGRAGTTFIVELLTHLGCDTGFSKEDLKRYKSKNGRAGLEKELVTDAPYIVKNPAFCEQAEEIFSRDDLIIDYLIIPIRDLKAAAESRRHVQKSGQSRQSFRSRIKFWQPQKNFAGGMLTDNTGRKVKNQEALLMKRLYDLMLAASSSNVPIILIKYPKSTRDPLYLYEKLKPILLDVEFNTFSSVYSEVVKPQMVNSFSKDDK
ncbi:MAG: hypothetical protein AAF741_03740 [Bacteroidota bacterium]